MNSNEELADCLTKPENLEFALELASHLDDLKNKLHPQFWERFNLEMGNIVSGSEFNSYWKFHKFQTSKYRSTWGKSILTPIKDDGSVLQMTFGQGIKGNGFRLFWGVGWNEPPKNLQDQFIGKLDAAFLDLDITIEEKPNWNRWGYTPYKIYSADFLRRMHNDPEELTKELHDKVWELFLILRPMMEEINYLIEDK